MAHSNYTLEDLTAGAAACILFASVAFAPGYLLGWLTNILSFRNRRVSTKLLLATVLAMAVSPIACYWAGWLCGETGLRLFAGASSVGALILVVNDLRRGSDLTTRTSIIAASIILGWVLVCIGSLVDLQIQDRLYFSPVAHDYSVRAAITDAIGRTGVRPMSPFFLPGAPVPLRYHHFLYILCSVVDRIGGRMVDAHQSLIGGAVWTGIGLIATVPLYLRFFCGVSRDVVQRRSLVGIGLLAVTGLDLIPVLILWKFGGSVQPDSESWNSPIVSWFGSILWAPHHVAALVACLTGFLLLWRFPDGNRQRLAVVILAGLAFASATGLSIYVSMVFTVFLGLWTLWAAIGRRRAECLMFVASFGVAALLSIPYLLTLFPNGQAGSGAGSPPITPWIRTFRIAEIMMSAKHLGPWWRLAIHFLLLPVNYFLEFGFFAISGMLTWKRYRAKRLAQHELALSLLASTSLLITTFLRSSVIPYNDLGMRGILFAQFVLLLWAVELWPDWRAVSSGYRTALFFSLAIGAAGTLYQAGMLRIFPILADRGDVSMPDWLCTDRKLGRRTMAMRLAYSALQTSLPRNAVIQNNPDIPIDDYFFGLYGNRQTRAATRDCDVSFGGSRSDCDLLVGRISPLFMPSFKKPAAGFDGLTVLIFKDTDPVWADRNSWIWRMSPLFENDCVRVIRAAAYEDH